MTQQVIQQLILFLRDYAAIIVVVVFVLGEIRRLMIPKVERWRQDVGSIWFYVAVLGVLYYFLQTSAFWRGGRWVSEQLIVLMILVAFTGLRSIVSGIRLHYWKPPQREGNQTGNVRYK